MQDPELRKISKRLEELERKIELRKIILEDRNEVAGDGELENKAYYSTPDGGIVKTTKVRMFCDWCGRRLNESFDMCVACGKKICSECSVYFEGKILCPECLESSYPLSKDEFKILKALASEIKDLDTIATVTRIKRDTIRKCISSLKEKELIQKEGFFPFYEISVLDKGLEVLSAYEQVFRSHEDVAIFEEELERVLIEKP
jgi:DNA-binding MarR family transcriptional regulator